MKKSNQIEPVFPGKELISLPANNALIGTLEDLSLGTKTSEKRSSIAAGAIARNEERLIHLALRKSKQD